MSNLILRNNVTEEKDSSGDRIREAYQALAKLRQQGDPGSLTLVIGIILLLMPFLSYPFISGGSSGNWLLWICSGVLHAGCNGNFRHDFSRYSST